MRASYRKAVAWIAYNDSAAEEGNLDPEVVSELVSVALVADLFGKEDRKVAEAVVRYRKKEQGK